MTAAYESEIYTMQKLAQEDAKILKAKGIKSPDLSQMKAVKIDFQTTYFYHKKQK